MKYRFQVGDLVKVRATGFMGVVTARKIVNCSPTAWEKATPIICEKYTIAGMGIPITLSAEELTKVSK